jgi:hypothetical protein
MHCTDEHSTLLEPPQLKIDYLRATDLPKMPLNASFLPRRAGMGHPDQRTLWIFGAGASAHLEFPMSWGFFRSTIKFLTGFYRDPSESSFDLGISTFPNLFKKSNGTSIDKGEFLRIKTDPVAAFECIGLHEYAKPENHQDEVRLQYLHRELRELRPRLAEAGIHLVTEDLLNIPPEDLIQQIRNLDANQIYQTNAKGRDVDRIKLDLQAAIECVRKIYFYALSEFNERARSLVETNIGNSCYDQLVRAFAFEHNSRIISFNYDTMLDESLFNRCTSSWAYDGIPVHGINGYPVAPGDDPDLYYIKPHGSLNMIYCRNCNGMHVQWFARIVPRGAGTIASDNRRCTHCKSPEAGRTELMQGLQVAPLYDKAVIDGSKEAITRAFAWADNIISIGFSFPEQDAYFFECMAKGLSNNQASTVSFSLVLRGHDETKELRDRLLTRLPILSEQKFQVEATKCIGFEDI